MNAPSSSQLFRHSIIYFDRNASSLENTYHCIFNIHMYSNICTVYINQLSKTRYLHGMHDTISCYSVESLHEAQLFLLYVCLCVRVCVRLCDRVSSTVNLLILLDGREHMNTFYHHNYCTN